MPRFWSLHTTIWLIILYSFAGTVDSSPCLRQTRIKRRHDIGISPSIQDADCGMYAIRPSELGGGHQAVFVDKNGNVEDAREKDLVIRTNNNKNDKNHYYHAINPNHAEMDLNPIDGFPIHFETDGQKIAEHLHANNREVNYETLEGSLPQGDDPAVAKTMRAIEESDNVNSLHMASAEGVNHPVTSQQFLDPIVHFSHQDDGFQPHHQERKQKHHHKEEPTEIHGFHDYIEFHHDKGSPHEDEGHHGGGHHNEDGNHGGGHGDDHNEGHGGHHEEGGHGEGGHGEGGHHEGGGHGGGHHEGGGHGGGGHEGGGHEGGGHEGEGHEGGGHEEGGHGDHHYASEDTKEESSESHGHGGGHGGGHHGGGHHGGENHEEGGHHGGGHGEGHHEGGGGHGEGHHYASQDSTEDSSGDGENTSNKKLSQKEKQKQFGSYVHEGKSTKVEFSEEDQNPYHKQSKNEGEPLNEKAQKPKKSGGEESDNEVAEKDDNYVFMLGKSNKKLDEGNLPNVFKELVHDAKALTNKIKSKNQKEKTGSVKFDGNKNVKNKNLAQFGQLKNNGEDDKTQMQSPDPVSSDTDKSLNHNDGGGTEKQNKESTTSSSSKASEQSRVISMLKKYVQQKSRGKNMYADNENNGNIINNLLSSQHKLQNQQQQKGADNYDLGDLGDTKKNYDNNNNNIKKDKDVERVAQNIINKFTTKSGVLDLPNDVVVEADGKTAAGDIMNKATAIGKSQKKQEGCCGPAVATPPPPPPQETSPQETAPRIHPQQPNAPAPAQPPVPEDEPEPKAKLKKAVKGGSSLEQEKLHKLLERKQKLDQLQSEYEHELASFKSELQQEKPPDTTTTTGNSKSAEGANGQDLVLPKEMNGGCDKDLKELQEMEQCLKAKKMENQAGESSPSENDPQKELDSESTPDKPSPPLEAKDDGDGEGSISSSSKTESDSLSQAMKPVPFDKKKQEKEAAKVLNDFKQETAIGLLEEQLSAKNKDAKKEQPIEASPDRLPEAMRQNELAKVNEKVQEDKLSEEEDNKIQADLFGKLKKARETNTKDEESGGKSSSESKDQQQTNENEDSERTGNQDTTEEKQTSSASGEASTQSAKQEGCVKTTPGCSTTGELTITSDEDLFKPQNDKDKEKIVQQITKLQKALSSYYKSTKSQTAVPPSTPIVLVHEIKVVPTASNKDETVDKQLNKQITDLKELLKEQQKSECQPRLTNIKGKLILNTDCEEKKRSSNDNKKKKRSNLHFRSNKTQKSAVKKSSISKLQKILTNIK